MLNNKRSVAKNKREVEKERKKVKERLSKKSASDMENANKYNKKWMSWAKELNRESETEIT